LNGEHAFPHIANLGLYLAAVVTDAVGCSQTALLNVPDAFPRLLSIPGEGEADVCETVELAEVASSSLVWLEQVVAANLDLVLLDAQVLSAHPCRVTWDADREIRKDRSEDLLAATEEMLWQREIGAPVRLELD
jgi:polyphosphate kinase